jgi:hypothetical protein
LAALSQPMPTRRTHIAAVPRRIATPVDFVDKGLTVLHAAVAKVSHPGFDVRVPEEIHNLFQLYTALVQRGRVASPEGVEGLLLTLLAICLAAGPAVAAIQPPRPSPASSGAAATWCAACPRPSRSDPLCPSRRAPPPRKEYKRRFVMRWAEGAMRHHEGGGFPHAGVSGRRGRNVERTRACLCASESLLLRP